jgi:hypothetical protein
MIRTWTRFLATALMLTGMIACGGSNAAPSQNAAAQGTWSGTVGAGSGGGRALRVTWSASQNGSAVSGPATFLTSPAVTAISISGSLTGSLTGNQLSLKYIGSPEGVADSAGCSVSGTGSATISGSSISGSLDVTFSSCDSLGLLPPADDALNLAKL